MFCVAFYWKCKVYWNRKIQHCGEVRQQTQIMLCFFIIRLLVFSSMYRRLFLWSETWVSSPSTRTSTALNPSCDTKLLIDDLNRSPNARKQTCDTFYFCAILQVTVFFLPFSLHFVMCGSPSGFHHPIDVYPNHSVHHRVQQPEFVVSLG